MATIDAEIVDGLTWILFRPGELGLRVGSDNRVELVPNTELAALTLSAIRRGTLRPTCGASVKLGIAVENGKEIVIPSWDGSEARRRRESAERRPLKITG